MQKNKQTLATILAFVISVLIWTTLAFAMWSCGGSGGDATDPEEQLPTNQYLLCSHNGDLWLCPEAATNSCIRDQSSVDSGSQTDSARLLMAMRWKGQTRFFMKLSENTIIIIAECGADVTFSNGEAQETDANTTNTNVSFSGGAE